MKKLVIFLLAFSLLMFISSGIFAAECRVVGDEDNIGGPDCYANQAPYLLMKISDSTNAHGEIKEQTNYKFGICCDFPGSAASCDGSSNKVLGLSSPTNAHAEAPDASPAMYTTTNICYGDLSCVTTTQTTCPADKPIPILSLSANTNAHVGAFADYSTKICCSTSSFLVEKCILEDAYWSTNEFHDPLGDLDHDGKGDTTLLTGQTAYLIVEGNSACNGESISFNILEDDGVLAGNAVTPNPNPATFSNGKAVTTWMTKYQGDELLGGDPEFKFIATLVDDNSKEINSKEENNPLLVVEEMTESKWCSDNSPTLCENLPQERCSDNTCDVAKNAGTCEGDVVCSCYRDTTDGKCHTLVGETASIRTFCSDGDITNPNSNGIQEQCDPGDPPLIPLNLDGKHLCTNFQGYTSLGSSTAPGCSSGGDNQCQFVLQGSCSGIPAHENGVIETQIGEECDFDTSGNQILITSCSNYGMSGTGLSCYPKGNPNEFKVNKELCEAPTCSIDDDCLNTDYKCVSNRCALAADGQCNSNYQGSISPCPEDYPICTTDRICVAGEIGTSACESDNDCSPNEMCIFDIEGIGQCATEGEGRNDLKYCGDNLVTSPNDAVPPMLEQCDLGKDRLGNAGMSGKTCLSVSGNFYDGGILNCRGYCRYDVSNCLKEGVISSQISFAELCGNGILDSDAEECDTRTATGETDWGIFGQSCKGLGYDSGDLKCGADCKVDKNSCIEPSKELIDPSSRCQTISQTEDANGCVGGFISYSWKSTWTGTGIAPNWCKDGSKSLACPSEVQLPFFDALQFIITALAISAIYAVMILRKRKKRND